MEPSRECILDRARRLWYRRDKYFDATTERALAHSDISKAGGVWVQCRTGRVLPGPGILFDLP